MSTILFIYYYIFDFIFEFTIVSVDIIVSRVSVTSMTSEPEILLETSKLLFLSELLSLLGSTSGGAPSSPQNHLYQHLTSNLMIKALTNVLVNVGVETLSNSKHISPLTQSMRRKRFQTLGE